jgi:hypothetical protein
MVGTRTVCDVGGTLQHFVSGHASHGLLGELTHVEADPKLLKLRCRGSSLVERRPEKAGVASSILAPGTIDTATL